MFFTGIVSSVLGLVTFNSLEESPLRKQPQTTKTRTKLEAHPIQTLFSWEYHGILLVSILLTMDGGSACYPISGYLPTFLKIMMKAPAGESAALLMVSSLAVIVASVAAGHLSSLAGRKRPFLLIGAITLILLPLLYQWLPAASTMTTGLVYTASLSMLGCAGFTPILIFLNEQFPTSIHASGTELLWGIGFVIGGMISTLALLIARTPANPPHVLGVTIGAVALLYLADTLTVPETTGRLGGN